jgi:hypothetical protein
MIALRYVYVVALVFWVGGALTLGGVVAPAAFAVLDPPGAPPQASQAALVVGEALRRFHLVAYGAGATLLSTLLLMKVVGPRPPGFGARLAAMRAEIGVPVRTLAPEDARRVRFGRLHGLSTALMAAAALGGLVLCYWETRE